jgi:taurine transport system permease protein
MSEYRSSIAAVLILLFLASFVGAIVIGRRQARATAKDAVFGDPVRTTGGWYWALCGLSALMLVWFYYSWGVGRAYFPDAANEFCQVAKLEESVAPIKAALPIGSRYYKSTLLVARNSAQLDDLAAGLPAGAFSAAEEAELLGIIAATKEVIANSSNPDLVNPDAAAELQGIVARLDALSAGLTEGANAAALTPSAEALAQPRWGTTFTEIPILPITARGVLFDQAALEAAEITEAFNKIRNAFPENDRLIAATQARIDALKDANETGSFDAPIAEAISASHSR